MMGASALEARRLWADIESADQGRLAIREGPPKAVAADGVRRDEVRGEFFLLAIEHLQRRQVQLLADDRLNEHIAAATIARRPHFARARALGRCGRLHERRRGSGRC